MVFYSREDTFNILEKIVELRYQNDFQLYLNEVEKSGLKVLKNFSSTDLDTHKSELIEYIKSKMCNDLEDTVSRMEITYCENEYVHLLQKPLAIPYHQDLLNQ